MESTSTECDCSTKLKEQHEEMKACYEELDKRVCTLGQKSLESVRRALEESESVKSQVDKKYQEVYATICQLQTSYDELKAEKEALEKRSNSNFKIMRDENHIDYLTKNEKDKKRDVNILTKKVNDQEKYIESLKTKVKDKERDRLGEMGKMVLEENKVEVQDKEIKKAKKKEEGMVEMSKNKEGAEKVGLFFKKELVKKTQFELNKRDT